MARVSILRKRNKLYAVTAQVDPPGVIDGVLVDPEEYFFWLIQRQPDQPADDWEWVLTNSGIPEGLPPGVKPTDNGYYGMTQQIGSGGVRGRIFLPTGVPDANGYYARAYSPLKDAEEEGHLLWEWRYLEGPPYVPVTTPSNGGGGTVPPSTGLTEQQVQEMIDKSIAEAMENTPGVQYGDKIALEMSSGLLIGVNGEVTGENQPVPLIAKTGDAHAWESYKLRKGE